MYMGIRRRPRDTVGPYEAHPHARDMTECAAKTRGGHWSVVPVQVIELDARCKYDCQGDISRKEAK